MARKKNGPNMSSAIREYLTENPTASAKDVSAAMGSKGIYPKASLIYFVMGKARGRKGRRRKIARAAQAAVGTDNGASVGKHADAITLIRDIKALAAKTGGIRKLKALVEALAE